MWKQKPLQLSAPELVEVTRVLYCDDLNWMVIEFSVYYIFFGFGTCFSQTLEPASNTLRDVTRACYFHTVKITLLIFSHCENKSLWKISLLFNEKKQYFTADNEIKILTSSQFVEVNHFAFTEHCCIYFFSLPFHVPHCLTMIILLLCVGGLGWGFFKCFPMKFNL